ncbi:hypothetical protein [Schlesneria paludicola]|uniref:hypothetical protein n=1 Tax=Schlesneria paludicola TaxID=360056 RepID=UPI000492E03C|nr:hypothetical protein [Schlesneria paludicola]
MSPRLLRRIVTCLALAVFLSAAIVLWQPIPVELTQTPGEQHRRSFGSSEGSSTPQPQVLEQKLTVRDFESYWQQPLRRALYDPPPPPPPPPKVVEIPPPRPITARLLATMIEPGNSMAMLQLQTGEVVFRKLGDEIGASDTGATISAIEEGVVNVERDKVVTKLAVSNQGAR